MYEEQEMERHGYVKIGGYLDKSNNDIRLAQLKEQIYNKDLKQRSLSAKQGKNTKRVLQAAQALTSNVEKFQRPQTSKEKQRKLDFRLSQDKTYDANLLSQTLDLSNNSKIIQQNYKAYSKDLINLGSFDKNNFKTLSFVVNENQTASSPLLSPPTIQLKPVPLKHEISQDTGISQSPSNQISNPNKSYSIRNVNKYSQNFSNMQQNNTFNSNLSEISNLKKEIINFTSDIQNLRYQQASKFTNKSYGALVELENQYQNVRSSYEQSQENIKRQKIQERENDLQQKMALRQEVQMDEKLEKLRKNRQIMMRAYENFNEKENIKEIQKQRDEQVMHMVNDRQRTNQQLKKGDYYQEALSRLKYERNQNLPKSTSGQQKQQLSQLL